jgi:hypothetical protein
MLCFHMQRLTSQQLESIKSSDRRRGVERSRVGGSSVTVLALQDAYVKHGYVANLQLLTDYIEFMKDSCQRIGGDSDFFKQIDHIARAHRMRITDLFPGGSQASCVRNALDKKLLFDQGEYDDIQNSLHPDGKQIYFLYKAKKDNDRTLGRNPSSPAHHHQGRHWHIMDAGSYYYCIDADVLLCKHGWTYEKYRAVALAMLAVCIGGIETGLDSTDSGTSATRVTRALEHLRRSASLFVQLVQSESNPQNPRRQGKFVQEICLDVSMLSERLCLLITKIAQRIHVDHSTGVANSGEIQEELCWMCERLKVHQSFQQALNKSKIKRQALIDGVEWMEFEQLFFPRPGRIYYANKVRSSRSCSPNRFEYLQACTAMSAHLTPCVFLHSEQEIFSLK